MRPTFQIIWLAIALASCSKKEPASGSQPRQPELAPAVVSAPGWVLALDGEGLRIFNSNTGASRLLAFGDDARQSMETLGRVLGEQPPVSVENEECQVDFARWSNGLTVWSSNSRFTGWSVAPGSPTLSTASGVKIGSTRVELESAYDAEIMESSLGTEFLAGGLAGVLDSARPDAKISNLWAGETCIAR
ncbi:MAG: hypothetical protein A3E01_04225 [Gammaproteobacteria bacterium RIFCSPHIGHO2_12_FULL_63_22]|nr:MAG: hypothetical protein A3E01_04225 [Gammaproteobacteria bacterium RIFCSPHIGHO2_12_FULL_63_22]